MYIVERLATFRFRIVNGSIEYAAGKKSLHRLLTYCKTKDLKRCKIWKKIFVTYCSLIEYGFFDICEGTKPFTLEQNLVYKARSIHAFDWKPLKDGTEQMLSSTTNIELKSCLEKFGQTIDVLNNTTGADGKVIVANSRDLGDRYSSADLGLVKWASRI